MAGGTVYALQQIRKFTLVEQIAITATPQNVMTLAATALGTTVDELSEFGQVMTITNNDASATIYISPSTSPSASSPTVSSTLFFKKLVAGEYFEQLLADDSMKQFWIVASGNCNALVTIGQ